ncbi:HlyC/CorC family transporter [Nocardioides dongxiaopingii]|uniref:hemolysin family protein n=1 Tax=Nocardioides sp. S-1144 TaxID=2582905 RepID=UPI00110DC593|nr:hemolysin family protein [Nocardioides sp. S-1144]QCW51161.1 HlyC/CorC family transporter [Nocardioides sp. S-1144]
MNEWVMLGIGLLLTVGTGIFVASEFALVNLDRHDLEKRRDAGEKRLGPTIGALRITSTHLSSAQLGITLTTLLTGYTFEPAVSSLLREPLTGAGVPEGAVPGVGAVVGVLLATLFSMVVGELVPKNFALAVPLATAKLVVPLQVAFTTVLKPVIVLLNNTANGLIRAMGIEPKEELTGARTADELTYLIRHSASQGLLEKDDATLLDRSLRIAERDASDVMTPRTQMTSVGLGATAAQVIAAAAASGHSRLPVTHGGPDDIVGVVHVKQAFAVALKARDTTPAADLMVEPVRVPESLGALALLERLRGEGLQLAVVTDEYGGTAGVVTVEDLVEELIGELEDEHDRYHSMLTRRGRSVTFDATWRPDELAARAGVHVPEDDDWDTVGGFLAARLERIPEPGDEVEVDGGLLRVERADEQRVTRILFVPADPDGDLAGHPGGPAPAAVPTTEEAR